jgi:hypothetical protein
MSVSVISCVIGLFRQAFNKVGVGGGGGGVKYNFLGLDKNDRLAASLIFSVSSL